MTQPPPDVLLVGCGELGAEIGRRLAVRGHRVAAIRRRADLVPPPLVGVSADLTREAPRLPPLDLAHLVVALAARPRTEDAYRATYVDGMRRALDAVEAGGAAPRRAVLVSSSGVFGDAGPEPVLDERSPAVPADGPGRVLLAAEELFAERLPGGTVLRLSGLYGGDSTFLLDQVREGRVTDPHRWTNRIHREDAAAAVVHLLTRDADPDRLYVGTDDEPTQLGDVAAHLAALSGAPTPPAADPASGHGKRLSNARLRASGWTPRYPSYREGYPG
ncbi:NAD dependent epimerase/dehydratase family protein [Aeromicrobium marinum DSM 15272]|uniref:NAD dependent epimerase/dehydratase family protein n=1 Tax=Aeromicrobium marinum DSM 15272 TaxID=585531 RepID=E2SCH7_9ACTN|nr:NAD-dependent epimerase/dehydratase family protein [Aeromicrobium marinum]EFQ82930.1 NAD dependent epimerase/dehydratase family protein [Aeromicrobium marinum DSM 15272]